MGLAFYKSQQYTESYQGLYHMILMSRSESFILWMWKLVMIYDIVIGVSKCYWILTAYDKALEVSTNDTDSSQIHAALGMVAYKFGDMDGAKSSLFQRLEILIYIWSFIIKYFTKNDMSKRVYNMMMNILKRITFNQIDWKVFGFSIFNPANICILK